MIQLIKQTIACFILLAAFTQVHAENSELAKQKDYIELRVYHFSNNTQEGMIDSFLRNYFIPIANKNGVSTVGVFKPIANDTAADKKIVVLVPYKSIKQWQKLSPALFDAGAGSSYTEAAYNATAYTRFESIFLTAFNYMPHVTAPKLNGEKNQRVYELRSYEGPTEKYFKNKVHMFNEGGEMDIFQRLGFNAVFYGEVLFGSKMPNLMYMTSFENMKVRDEHWKAFGSSPDWKNLSGQKQYQNNMSHADITFLRPTDYSQL